MEQAGKYAHENGYFGVIGIDILEDDNDNLWVIDGNIRINGTTPLHLMRPLLTPSGIAIAKFSTEWAFQGTLDETLSNLFSEISKQRFIILSAVESKEKTEIYGVSTGKNTKDQEQNEKQLAKKGLTITT
jgi:hypothetical protein